MVDTIVERVAQAVGGEIRRQWNEPNRATANLDVVRIAKAAVDACGLANALIDPQCSNCAFYDGFCRRRAPGPRTRGDHPETAWRKVEQTDWCGEFQVSPAAIAMALEAERRAMQEKKAAEARQAHAEAEAEREAKAKESEAKRKAVLAEEAARAAGAARAAARRAAEARAAMEAFDAERAPEPPAPAAKPKGGKREALKVQEAAAP